MPKRALIYQIYPSAFGNLRTIADRLPDIAKSIAPDYIWLSPIFKSPWREGGYDVADYQAIDPRFGKLQDLQHLISVAQKHNIKILLDLVLNHTSIEHPWFDKSSHRDPYYANYYVWMDRPLNWKSFFGGPACEYDATRGQYYLHLFDKSQPDLNFSEPRVIREFQKIINYWVEQGIAGFRVDSANVLSESRLRHGVLPHIPGFFYYYQTKHTVRALEKLFRGRQLFTIAEPVGGNFFSRAKLRQLTARAFDASFNIGTLDIADTWFSDKTHPRPTDYRKWFRKLARWTREPAFSFALESHDTPRAPSRFHADPRALAMLQFLLPSNFPCVYQGQEFGTQNPKLSNKINDYPGVQSKEIYHKLRAQGKSKRESMAIVKRVSRDNARQPLDWATYRKQLADPASTLNFYTQLIHLWRTDPVLAHGNLQITKTTRTGTLNFTRTYRTKTYSIHLDLSGKTPSTLTDHNGQIILTTQKTLLPIDKTPRSVI